MCKTREVNVFPNLLGRPAEPVEAELQALANADLLLAGFGSIGRPLAEEACGLGAARFTLVDPKRYTLRSVSSQCQIADVGQRKVSVGASQLRAHGAQVKAFARDLDAVPGGVLGDQTIVMTSVDNRRADMLANRMAASLRARLLKVNIEPALQVVAVRAYDFRRGVSQCAECQFLSRHYEMQHPRSCDGGAADRPTNSPRWLSELAAHLSLQVLLELAADGEAAQRWYGHEWQYCHETGRLHASELAPNMQCRWDHRRHWPNVQRLCEGPEELSLRTLLDEAGTGNQAQIQCCQQVSLRARCRGCRREVRQPRWLCDQARPVGRCDRCGHPLDAIPFWVFSSLDARQLVQVEDLPLSEWGVEGNAIINVQQGGSAVTFVVGSSRETEQVIN